MPTFFSDPSTGLYAILGVIVLVLAALAARRQKRPDAINFGIGAAVLLAVFLIDRAYESPREAVVRKLDEMKAASQAKKYDDMFKHVSDSFQYKSLTKKVAREKADMATSYFPDGINIWNADRKTFKELPDGTVEQEFDVQFVNAPQTRHICVGVFKKESDGEWRMTTFRLYPVVGGAGAGGERLEATVPGL